MRLQFVTIGQNLNWPRGRLSLPRKKKHRREFMTLALERVKRVSLVPRDTLIHFDKQNFLQLLGNDHR